LLLDCPDALQDSGDASRGDILEYLSIVVSEPTELKAANAATVDSTTVFMPIALSWPLLQRLHHTNQLGADALRFLFLSVRDGIRLCRVCFHSFKVSFHPTGS